MRLDPISEKTEWEFAKADVIPVPRLFVNILSLGRANGRAYFKDNKGKNHLTILFFSFTPLNLLWIVT